MKVHLLNRSKKAECGADPVVMRHATNPMLVTCDACQDSFEWTVALMEWHHSPRSERYKRN